MYQNRDERERVKTLYACGIINTRLIEGKRETMSKVAAYLNEHILGEVVTDDAVRTRLSTDASVLTLKPEMVVYPRVTNDIRKVARFAWQLAEKGHILPLTARGAGFDDTGAAISKGALIVTTAHMNQVFEYDAKQKLVRVQPGVNAGTLNAALRLQGATVPILGSDAAYTSIGGAVAYGSANHMSGKYGTIENWVSQLEVVLASGDVLQTKRLSKRELNRKKGLQGFEGDIYRKIDALIEDNKQLINEQLSDENDSVGYSSLSRVKRKDGSLDLMPLFAGSQGTLGLISEMILRTEFIGVDPTVAVLTFTDSNTARDAVDDLVRLRPAALEYFDAAYFEAARAQGKRYPVYEEAAKDREIEAVIVVTFDDFSRRIQQKNVKKVKKVAEKHGATFTPSDDTNIDQLRSLRDVTLFTTMPSGKEVSAPPLFDGAYVPFERFEGFASAVVELAKKYHVSLPLYVRPYEGIVETRPNLQLGKVGDKQKVFRLLDEYATLVASHNGYLIGESREGRFKAPIAYKQVSDELKELFSQVKTIFDPHGTLNPGVKQPGDLKSVVSHLRANYSAADTAGHAPRR